VALKDGNKVKIAFTLETEDSVIDGAPEERPFEFVVGDGRLNPHLEGLLRKLGVGDSFDFSLEGEIAFGERKPELAMEIVRRKLPAHLGELSEGMFFETLGPDKKLHRFRVTKTNENKVWIDGNHPLAGVPLQFTGKILSVD
jgi:FKBP-type peptidyl-prolyl cis-trans isomerase 2